MLDKDDVLAIIRGAVTKRDYGVKYKNVVLINGKRIKMTPVLRLIGRDGETCAHCDTKITHFGSDRNNPLLAYTDNGSHMTADHIVPKSAGGTLHMYNLQLLCRRCNRRKSNTFDKNETQKAVNLVRTKYKYCENADNSLVRDAWKIEHQSFTTWLYKNGITSPFVAGDLLKMYIQHMQESGFDVVPYLTYMPAHKTCVCSVMKEIA